MSEPFQPVYWRYRTDWRGRLILQCMVDPMGLSGPDHRGRIGAFAHWRDASATDLTRTDCKPPQTPLAGSKEC